MARGSTVTVVFAAAARIYRAAGFSVVWHQQTVWNGEPVVHQLYELTLDAPMTP